MRAETLLADGLAKFDAKDYRGAIERWERLAVDEKRYRILYNLGLAYEAAGDRVSATLRFDAFVRRVAEEAGSLPPELEERRQDAAERARALKSALAVLRVTVESETKESLVARVDDAEERAVPFEIYVEPGPRVIIVRSEQRTKRFDADTFAGRRTDVIASLPPVVVTAPPELPRTPPPQAEPGRFPTPWFVAGLSSTVVSFALPLGLGIRTSELREEALALGPGHTRYADNLDTYEDTRAGYYASFALPIALGVATTIIAVWGISEATSSGSGSAPGAVSFAVDGRGVGVMFR